MKWINIISCSLFLTSLESIAAEQDFASDARHLHELCASQANHQDAVELLTHTSATSYINIPDENGRTALHHVAVFLWAPQQDVPDSHGQGQDALGIKATYARQLAELLISQGAKNSTDNSDIDCVAKAGQAWLDPGPSSAEINDNYCDQEKYEDGRQATRKWLRGQLKQEK